MAGGRFKATEPRAVGIYVRISADRAGQGLGVERQAQDGRDLAKRKGWALTPDPIYSDNDRSAYTGKPRPAYDRLLADIESGAVDGVIVYQLDRLYRRPVELEHFITLADAHRVHLATVAGDIDLGTAQGRQFARSLGNAAAYESEIKGERIKRMHEQLAEAGKLSGGGHRPFGYENDRKAVRAAEAQYIRDAARRVLAGESMNSIVREWNARGLQTTGGKAWDVTGLRTILVSARISGRREHHGQITAQAAWRGIISAQDSDRLRRVLGRARHRGAGAPAKRLLTGLLRCGRCSGALSGSRAPSTKLMLANGGEKHGTLAYACAHHPRNRPNACGRIRVRAAALETYLTEMALTLVDTPKLAARINAKRGSRKRETAFDIVAQVEADLRMLAADWGDGRITRPEYVAARGPMERRLAAAQQRLNAEQGTSALNGLGEPGQVRKAWPTLSVDRRRAILSVLFDHVVIAPANPSIPRNRFDVGRVKVIWKV